MKFIIQLKDNIDLFCISSWLADYPMARGF